MNFLLKNKAGDLDDIVIAAKIDSERRIGVCICRAIYTLLEQIARFKRKVKTRRNYCDSVQECEELGRKLWSVWSRFPDYHPIHISARALWNDIIIAGCYQKYSTNPHVQYAATQYRRATQPSDVIYGSMQIYGLRLGEASGLSV